MNITLPNKKGNPNTNPEINTDVLVVVGANGSGKTRFGTDIENRYQSISHRISAQKSLAMPERVATSTKEAAEKTFWFGSGTSTHSNKNNNRWNRKPNLHLLNDYNHLMTLLHTDEYEESVKFRQDYEEGQTVSKPLTKLDKIKLIWEEVLSHRKLKISAGTIETYPTGQDANIYNASQMSDGERVVFYMIGEVNCSPENSIIIIDEPELHLHKSISRILYDKIENSRPDCSYVYLTHDLDFAFSRESAKKIWAKSYEGNNLWDYEILDEESQFPNQLYLEVLGSRKPVLFIEGDENSIDSKLYPRVFQEHTVKSLGSCVKVINIVKSFNDLSAFHHIESVGLIDRDRRTNEEITGLNSNKIWVCDVAEIENLLLIEDIIKEVAVSMMKTKPEQIVTQVKENVITFFTQRLDEQVLIHFKAKTQKSFKQASNLDGVNEFEVMKANLEGFWAAQNFDEQIQIIRTQFQEFIDTNNYDEILRVFNNKGILTNSRVMDLCGISTRNNAYLNHIIALIRKDNEMSERIKTAIKAKINAT